MSQVFEPSPQGVFLVVTFLRQLHSHSQTSTYLQHLGRKSDWSLDSQVLCLSTLNEFSADFLERCDFSAGESDSDLVDFLIVSVSIFFASPIAMFVRDAQSSS